MSRIDIICGEIESCKTFCDIGCDHGYIAEYVLKNNICGRAIITDISKKSLEKAEKLLYRYIQEGKCFSLCTDGLNNIDKKIDTAVIAGMGGMEIISILQTDNLPDILILQPMKNSYELRKYLITKYKIIKDYTFCEGKRCYDLIVAKKGTDSLTESELLFGRTNLILKGSDFLKKTAEEIKKTEKYLSKELNEKSKIELEERLKTLKEIVNESN